MLPSFAVQTVTVVTPHVTLDNRNLEVRSYEESAGATRRQVYGCVLNPSTSQETTFGRDTITGDYQLLLPPADPIGARDAVEVDGDLYVIVGEVGHWKSPTGAVSHVAVTLRRWS